MSFPHTLSTFRARFPEFVPTDDDAVSSALSAAAAEIDSVVWGDLAAEGHALLAANKLALGPYGRDARIAQDQRKTTYGVELERLQKLVGGSHRVVIDEVELGLWGVR